MNIFDICLLLVTVGIGIWGVRVGFVRQFGIMAGIGSGLVLAAFFTARLASMQSQSTARWAVLATLLIVLTVLYAHIGGHVGTWLQSKIKYHGKLRVVNGVAGGVIAALSVVYLVWAGTAMFDKVPSVFWARQIHSSYLFYAISHYLPRQPAVFTSLANSLTPNSHPRVFADAALPLGDAPSSNDDLSHVSLAAAQSVVKVEGVGCGVRSVGTGFKIKDDIVVTDAHVIAGSTKLTVKDSSGQTMEAESVYFDTKDDVAVLVARGAQGPALAFSSDIGGYGAPAVIIGFPAGLALKANQATLLRYMSARGYDIYNRSTVTRTVYSWLAVWYRVIPAVRY
jgi:uncharacterized membrane protein required for colicin V production